MSPPVHYNPLPMFGFRWRPFRLDRSVGACPDCGSPIYAEHVSHTCPTVLFESNEGSYIASFSYSFDHLSYNRLDVP